MTSKLFLFIFLLVPFVKSHCQGTSNIRAIDTDIFQSSAQHWYAIFDKGNVVNARNGQARYRNTDVAAIGDNILLYQKNNGGWPKNYDMLAILNDAQKDSLEKVKNITNTTFDNSTTFTHVACLAGIYNITGSEKYKTAAFRGLDFILAAQYSNGGWPQYFPLEKNYSRQITYNDDMYTGIMRLLKAIKENNSLYSFVDAARRKKISAAFDKGIDCILKTQINDEGKPTAWCQQYDEVTLKPAWARAFEPPSICNGESAGLVLFLMTIKHPTAAVIKAVDDAYNWFNESKIYNTRVKTVQAPDTTFRFRHSSTDRIVVEDKTAPPIWTRYYELNTHRPLFCNRDSKVVYSLAEVDRERRDGYGWYTYEPQKVLDRYSDWKKSVAKKIF